MIIIAWGGAREGGREGCLEKLEAVVGFAALDDGFFPMLRRRHFFTMNDGRSTARTD